VTTTHQCQPKCFGLWCADGTRGQFEVGSDTCLKCGAKAMDHSTGPRCER